MTNNRVEWIDFAKGVAILLVVLGHSGLEIEGARYLNAFVYSFHLPLFFILSGILFVNFSKGKRIDYFNGVLKKRFYSLIIPYMTYAIIHKLWSVVVTYFHFHVWSFDLPTVLLGILVQVRDSQYSGGVWFICWMFTTQMIATLISIISTNNKVRNLIYIVCFSVGCFFLTFHYALPWHLDAALVAVIFLRLGELYRLYEIKIDKLLTTRLGLVLLFLCYVVTALANYILSGYRFPDMFSCFIGHPILYLFESATGSMLVVLFCKWLNDKRKFPLKKLLLDAGKNSLTIYGLHRIPLGILGVLYRLLLPINTGTYQIVRGLMLMLLCSIPLLPVAHWLKKRCPIPFGYKNR